ncbi:MAG: DNA polymerase IV [Gammaproteobacteria bacterium]
MKKIVHIDMDAFYASVEQRDDPKLRGKPVVVAWQGMRSVVCAASYEARKFGIHSAMPAMRAERLCPDAVFVPPDFTRYRTVSQQIREIFHQHTELVEPLSLDEAYLDVTENKQGLPTATAVARQIRQEIFEATSLTASAGVAPAKFLAKIASDWRKPNGLFVIKPHQVMGFLDPLPVAKLPGVGKRTQESLKLMGINTVFDLRALELKELVDKFGKFGQRLYRLASGVDTSEVKANRPIKSISSEHTFSNDLLISELDDGIAAAVERTWAAAEKKRRRGRTVILKLKTSDFKTITRSLTPPTVPESEKELHSVVQELIKRVDLSALTRFRLVGVGLSNFLENEPDFLQPQLFAARQSEYSIDN